jgi:hypothetical protein
MVTNLENVKKIIVLIAITLLYLFINTLPTIKIPVYNYDAIPNPSSDTLGSIWTGQTWVTPEGKSWNWDKNIWE